MGKKSENPPAFSVLVIGEVLKTTKKAETVDDIVRRLVFRRKVLQVLGNRVNTKAREKAIRVIDDTLKKLDPDIYEKVKSGKFKIPDERVPKKYKKMYRYLVLGDVEKAEKEAQKASTKSEEEKTEEKKEATKSSSKSSKKSKRRRRKKEPDVQVSVNESESKEILEEALKELEKS